MQSGHVLQKNICLEYPHAIRLFLSCGILLQYLLDQCHTRNCKKNLSWLFWRGNCHAWGNLTQINLNEKYVVASEDLHGNIYQNKM